MPDRPPRKRIYPGGKTESKPMEDPMDYKPNKATAKGRKAHSFKSYSLSELWHDKHYVGRYTTGDDAGKRNGIEPAIVHELIENLFPYLLLASATLHSFRFINFDGQVEPIAKVVLQEDTPDGMLNVVINCHLVSNNDPTFFELTVVTAMVIGGFRMDSGQYAVEWTSGGATVKRMINSHLDTILAF